MGQFFGFVSEVIEEQGSETKNKERDKKRIPFRALFKIQKA